jgi:hypothetical protein
MSFSAHALLFFAPLRELIKPSGESRQISHEWHKQSTNLHDEICRENEWE